jgi:hypothetical protein
MLAISTMAFGVLLLAASALYACTTYWGQTTIENTSTDSGEFSVVGDPTSGMDRCDGAMDGGDSGATISADNSGETVRVEISKWEPKGQDSGGKDCEASSGDDDDGNGKEDSLADAGAEDVYINTYTGDGDDDGTKGDAYQDDDGDGVYEDNDSCGLLSCPYQNEDMGEASSERVGDCMGDGSNDDSVTNKKGPIGVLAYKNDTDGDGKDDGGEFDDSHDLVGDIDGDGINDVDITIDTASSSPSGHAGAICVSEGDGEDSAPQVPILIT